ncbi:hypothetical protein ACFVR1_18910 [Psychrobacillus sp. NPDC058041]|uniref:hypothetical protein n=1 Tax=Psychrobacillus sp. NPDC058041 TaxID=3346310 RepID=UPI0036DC93C6
MDNKIKTYEEFEARLKSQSIPEVEHSNSLKNKIMERKKISRPIYLRASFIAIFLSIFFTASIATAMQYTGWRLFNSEGKQVFEMKTMTQEEAAPHRKYDEVMKKYRWITNNLQETMPKGKIKYFLAVDGYEELGLTALAMIFKGEEIASVSQIPLEFKGSLLLNDDIQIPEEVKGSLFFDNESLNKYVLTEGKIYYKTPNLGVGEFEALSEEMYKEAKENNVEYTIREGWLTDDISEVSLMYNESKGSFGGIEIKLQSAQEGLSTTENVASYTKITELGIEYLYDPFFQQLFFVVENNSKKLLVSVRFTAKMEGKIVDSRDLITIAKNILY